MTLTLNALETNNDQNIFSSMLSQLQKENTILNIDPLSLYVLNSTNEKEGNILLL